MRDPQNSHVVEDIDGLTGAEMPQEASRFEVAWMEGPVDLESWLGTRLDQAARHPTWLALQETTARKRHGSNVVSLAALPAPSAWSPVAPHTAR